MSRSLRDVTLLAQRINVCVPTISLSGVRRRLWSCRKLNHGVVRKCGKLPPPHLPRQGQVTGVDGHHIYRFSLCNLAKGIVMSLFISGQHPLSSRERDNRNSDAPSRPTHDLAITDRSPPSLPTALVAISRGSTPTSLPHARESVRVPPSKSKKPKADPGLRENSESRLRLGSQQEENKLKAPGR